MFPELLVSLSNCKFCEIFLGCRYVDFLWREKHVLFIISVFVQLKYYSKSLQFETCEWNIKALNYLISHIWEAGNTE